MRGFVGWSALQRKTKRIIFAAATAGVVAVAAGLGVGIVYFQNANYQNTVADPAQIYADISAPPPKLNETPETEPGTEPVYDPKDQEDVATAAGVLSVIRQSALSSAAFKQKVIADAAWNEVLASSLGVIPPVLPNGVSVTVNKAADSDQLAFTVTKNKSSNVVSATVSEFVGDDQIALDNAAKALATIDVCSIPRTQFADYDITQQQYLPSVIQQLGLRYVGVSDGVSVQIAKPSGSLTLQFTLTKNQSTKLVSVPITKFTADDQVLVATVAKALTTVTQTSAKQSDFFRTVLVQTDFNKDAADKLGVALTTFPAEVSVRVTKVDFSTTLTFVVTKNDALQVVAVPVTSFLGDNDTYFAQTSALLSGLTASSLTQEAFMNLVQPKATFTPAIAGVLGVKFLDELWGEDITVSKTAGSLNLNFTLNKNGSSKILDVAISKFANNDQQDVDGFVAGFESSTTTTLDEAAFKALVINEEFTAAVATRMGIPYIDPPAGISVAVSKTAGSASIKFTASKNSFSAEANPTVTVFKGGDKLDVDAAAGLLVALTASSLAKNPFLAIVKTNVPWNAAIAGELGLSFRTLPAGVAVNLTKSAQSALLSFALVKGAVTRNVSVEVTSFAGDDKLEVDAAANALKAINTTTLTTSIFNALAYSQVNLTAALAQNLGITLPSLPAGVSVRLTKNAGSALLSFAITKNAATASATATITSFTGDTRVALAAASTTLGSISVTSLTEQAFKAAVYGGVVFNEQQAVLLGIAFPSLPTGLTVRLTKVAGSATLSFALTLSGQNGTAQAIVTRFTGDDLPAVQSAASLLAELTRTTLTSAAFTTKDQPQAPFTQAVAVALGLSYPANLPAGVSVDVAKIIGSTTVVFSLVKGQARQTVPVVVVNFATETTTPVPGDKTVSPQMRRAISYLSGFVDEDFTEPLPIRIFNYLRYNFVTLVGGASVDVWARQNEYNITISNALLLQYVRTLMLNVGIDIGSPGPYAFYQLLNPMKTILDELLADPDIASLKLSITFEGNDQTVPLYVKAYIPVLPTDPTIVKAASDAVRTSLPSKYYSYAGGPTDPPIRRELNDFIAQHPF